jgi:hypothetical protein
MDARSTKEDSPHDPSSAKKPYVAPVLVQWGTLRDMTQSVGKSKGPDGGKGKAPRRTG